MRTPRIGAGILAAALAALTAGIVTAGPAAADTGTAPAPAVVLAQDSTPAPATIPADVVGIDPDIVGGLTVTGHHGLPVSATAKGRPTRSVTAAPETPAVLRGLVPGVRYAIRIDGRAVATAVPVARVGAATGLRVRTTDTVGAVQLAWGHIVAPHEGPHVTYDVTAAPLNDDGSDGTPVLTAVATERAATLASLVTGRRYRFTVTPRNSAGPGRATTATMTRTLADLAGSSPTPPATPATVSAPPAAPAPAPAAPATRTVYVCPDGYAPAGDACTLTRAYTFHTETVAYTYHQGVIGFHTVKHPDTHCDYLPNPNSPTGLDIVCTGGYDEKVPDYGPVKDPTPNGYTDTGTAWTHQVKDPTPNGYTDTGTAWVKTTAMIALTVPA